LLLRPFVGNKLLGDCLACFDLADGGIGGRDHIGKIGFGNADTSLRFMKCGRWKMAHLFDNVYFFKQNCKPFRQLIIPYKIRYFKW